VSEFHFHDKRKEADALAHGWAEEAWLASLAQLRGTPFGPQTGRGLAPGGPALIDYCRDRIAARRKFMTDQDRITIPEWLGSVEVLETPSFLQPTSPGAWMRPPRLFAMVLPGRRRPKGSGRK
jgi:hypothetical protein